MTVNRSTTKPHMAFDADDARPTRAVARAICARRAWRTASGHPEANAVRPRRDQRRPSLGRGRKWRACPLTARFVDERACGLLRAAADGADASTADSHLARCTGGRQPSPRARRGGTAGSGGGGCGAIAQLCTASAAQVVQDSLCKLHKSGHAPLTRTLPALAPYIGDFWEISSICSAPGSVSQLACAVQNGWASVTTPGPSPGTPRSS